MKKLLLALLMLCGLAEAAELQPFGRGEMARLLAAREGRAFVLTLWSVDCPHCGTTLRQLAALAKSEPRLDLVVVNTDGVGADAGAIAAKLAAVGLGKRASWVFDDAPERLRFEIDRRWGGEMPRTYLFERDHKVAAYSGRIDGKVLKQWLARNPPSAASTAGTP